MLKNSSTQSSRWCSVPKNSSFHSRNIPFYSRNFTFITQEITNTLLKKFEGPLHGLRHLVILTMDVGKPLTVQPFGSSQRTENDHMHILQTQ